MGGASTITSAFKQTCVKSWLQNLARRNLLIAKLISAWSPQLLAGIVMFVNVTETPSNTHNLALHGPLWIIAECWLRHQLGCWLHLPSYAFVSWGSIQPGRHPVIGLLRDWSPQGLVSRGSSGSPECCVGAPEVVLWISSPCFFTCFLLWGNFRYFLQDPLGTQICQKIYVWLGWC